MFISTDVLYALHGNTLNINTSIHSTSQVSIQWYLNGASLNPASDDGYSVASDSSQSVLTIHSFGEGLVGRYEIVVSNMEGQNSSDGVSVLLPDEKGGELEKGRSIGDPCDIVCLYVCIVVEECAVKESDSFDRNILILIALPSISGLILLICVLVVLVTAVACYRCKR